MGLTEYALSQALFMALNHLDKSNILTKTADELDKLADSRLGERGSEQLQEKLVVQVLLPICRELMAENRQRYVQLLESEQYGNLGEAQRKPQRGSVQQVTVDRRVSGRGLGVLPGNKRDKLSGFTDGVVEA